jgi:uncharacterized protein
MALVKIRLGPGEATRGICDPPRGRGSGVAFVLSHGAGGDMRAKLLASMARGLSERGHFVLRFDFLYRSAGKKVPDRKPRLVDTYRKVVASLPRHGSFDRVVLAGKSMGGRMATHLAGDDGLTGGVVLFGYPLHPPHKRDQLRDEHLPGVPGPMLFFQGTRDPLCDLSLLRPILTPLPNARLHVIDGADHSLDVLKRSGRTSEDVATELLDTIEAWLETTYG